MAWTLKEDASVRMLRASTPCWSASVMAASTMARQESRSRAGPAVGGGGVVLAFLAGRLAMRSSPRGLPRAALQCILTM